MLERPLEDGALKIVARGERKDEATLELRMSITYYVVLPFLQGEKGIVPGQGARSAECAFRVATSRSHVS